MEAESSDRASAEKDSTLAQTEDSLRMSICRNSMALLRRCHDTPVFELDIPLCRMEVMTEVRLPMDPDVEKLRSEFTEGYKIGGPVFYVSTTSYQLQEKEVTDDARSAWSSLWQIEERKFEERLQSDPDLLKYSNKMFHVWDGNHRLKAWMPYIEDCHADDQGFHVSVKSIALKVTNNNSDIIFNAMTDWNK